MRPLGPFSVTREGLTFGVVSAGRVLVAFIASVLFLFTTLADDMLEALVARGVSHRLAFVVLSAVQMVPRMQDRAGSILDAQQARGLPIRGGFRVRVRALVPLIGPVLLGSLIDVRERTFALEARGFGARRQRTAYRVVADPPGDRLAPLGPRRGDGRRRRDRRDRRAGPVTAPRPVEETTGGGIAVRGLRVRYPGRSTPALAGVDLVAEPGQRVGVAGRTGAGKSTLALAVAGFLPRVVRATVEGEIAVGGVDPVRAAAAELARPRRHRFATPANQLSASKLTVREELAFGLENLGIPRGEMDARIDDVLDRLGIRHLEEREPFALSGGEQQRVAIASIVAMGSRVLALDEPTAQLDPAGTDAVAEAPRRARARRRDGARRGA